MISPYFQDGPAVSFGPPPGLAAILQQRAEQLDKDSKSAGKFLGAVGSAAVGAYQGATNPGVFGGAAGGSGGSGDVATGQGGAYMDGQPAMSSLGGGVRGAFQNFAASYGAGDNVASMGGGGGGGSAFGNMVGGSGGGGIMNVKQLQAAGKTADSLRDQMAQHTSSVGDDDPKVFGVTDDEWNTLGASDKWGKVQAYHQSLVDKEAGAKIQQMALLGQQLQQRIQAEQANSGAWQKAAENVASETLAQGNGPVQPRPVTWDDWGSAAQRGYPAAFNSPAATPYLQEMAGRYRPKPGWNLQPGQTVPGPNGMTGMAETPNSVHWAAAGKPAAVTEPDSTYGPATPEGNSAFQADVGKLRPLDAKRATDLRKTHLVQGAKTDLDVPENSDWLYSPNDKDFLAGIKQLKDPHQREAARQLRTETVKTLQKQTEMDRMMDKLNNPGGAPASDTATMTDPKGQTVIVPANQVESLKKKGYK